MADLAATVATEFADYYRKVAAELHEWVDPLPQEEFWHRPYAYGNSAGHVVLHITGNLSYYIGAREFTEARKLDKEEVLEAFDRTIDMVVASVRAQAPGDWMAAYSGEGEPEAANRLAIFLRCAAHAYHHVGQIIYLRQELARQADQKAISA
jgi:uncharacterized damage-inducible protein DinB